MVIADARWPVTARILVVDDEPDLEVLIVQRFRRQIRDGQFSFAFADDGVNALAMLAGRPTSTWSSSTSTCRGWTG